MLAVMFDRLRQTDKARGVSLAWRRDVNRPAVGRGGTTRISSEVTTKLTYSG